MLPYMHPRHVTIIKESGETPLQALSRVRDRYHIPTTIPLAYAGRLDPMASGKLLVLVGDECKKQEQYHALDKRYEFEILFGVRSDSGDILGIPTLAKAKQYTDSKLNALAHGTQKTLTLPYPTFSSKTVHGKPLFLWTLENRLGEIEIPKATTRIYALDYANSKSIARETLLRTIHERIALLPTVTEESKKLGADFRRKEILSAWDILLSSQKELLPHTFQIAQFSCICSSGTYIRSLVPYLAQKLGTSGLAYSINRTQIGTYLPLPLIGGVWLKKY